MREEEKDLLNDSFSFVECQPALECLFIVTIITVIIVHNI